MIDIIYVGELLFKAFFAVFIFIACRRTVENTLWKDWEIDRINGFKNPKLREALKLPKFYIGWFLIIVIAFIWIYLIFGFINVMRD